MAVNHFVFTKNCVVTTPEGKTFYSRGSEMNIGSKDGTEYVKDGCFSLFELQSPRAKAHGKIV